MSYQNYPQRPNQPYSISPEDTNNSNSARPYQVPFSDSISPLTPNTANSPHDSLSPIAHEMTGLYNNNNDSNRPRYLNEIGFQNSSYSLSSGVGDRGEKDDLSSYGEGKYGSDGEFKPLHEGGYSPNGNGGGFYKNEAPE